MIAGYVLLNIDPDTCTKFKRQIFDKLVGFAGSNSAHCRSIAHYFIQKLGEKEPALIGSALEPLIAYLSDAKDCQRMKEKYQEMLDTLLYKCLALEGAQQVLTYDLTVEGEFIGKTFVDELNKVTTDIMGQFRHVEEVPYEKKDWWKKDLEARKEDPDFNVTVTEESSNYQRKILPWNHVEFDTALQKRVFFQRRRNEIIMCASLIDKIPNLAGLARTSEIMNASSLVINHAAVCQTDEFKGISVTSEKWLPIYEVKERDLLDYLSYQKSNGYKIVGIEQTADSKMLHTFQFPTRCILLLGKEKEGIPQEYYSIMDFCVEIPQFGIIRSLNVHVTGALCLWEYTKQHMPPLPPSA
jgi:tRNA G18 (ribose-2'-O)-methylase SpoU